MKRVDLTIPEFMFIVGTRAFLAAGVGLLVADRFRRSTRRYVGATLVTLGALTTIPAAFVFFGSSQKAKAKNAIAAA
ncbi:MAG TPA: heparan-alpha-glucosaminide N-acetyltransferase domain-containing protein [Thermoanaerobaculia bacterium]|nr:heparan-alpha-glucosaminide N-acetyltransferase domain-containing protein [Thermoanaerobaculia bacterium]